MIDKRRCEVTVVIPLYNKEKYISETLQSLISQSYAHWEAIVVDDGSDDHSVNIVEKYTEDDKRIKLLHRVNYKKKKGGSVCRNIGIKASKGKYVIFLDADDILESWALKNRVEAMEKKQDMDFIVFPVGHFYTQVGDSNLIKNPDKDADHLIEFLSYKVPWHTSSGIWRKSFLYEIEFFNENYKRLQDIEFHTRALFEPNVNYTIYNKVDFYYRIDPDRITANNAVRVKIMVESFNLYLKNMYTIVKNKDPQDHTEMKYALRASVYKLLNKIVNENITFKEKMTLLSEVRKSNVFHELMTLKYKIKYLLLSLYFVFYKIIKDLKKRIKRDI